MVILPTKFSELSKAWSSLAYSTGSSVTYSSPSSTQGKHISNGNKNQSRCNAQVTWCNTCHDMRDVICNAYAGFGRENDEQGINLENQVCHWTDEMILVEIDIKITGNGCTVCKWQAKQEWHDSAINSMIALRIHQVTMLQHPQHSNKAYDSNKQEILDKRWTLSYG